MLRINIFFAGLFVAWFCLAFSLWVNLSHRATEKQKCIELGGQFKNDLCLAPGVLLMPPKDAQ